MPPWAEEATLDFEPEDPTPKEELSLALLLHLKEAAEAFNTAHENDKNPVDSLDWMNFASRFLWLNCHGSIEKANLIFAHDDSKARVFSAQRLKQCICPPVPASSALGDPAGGPETLVQLSAAPPNPSNLDSRLESLKVLLATQPDELKGTIISLSKEMLNLRATIKQREESYARFDKPSLNPTTGEIMNDEAGNPLPFIPNSLRSKCPVKPSAPMANEQSEQLSLNRRRKPSRNLSYGKWKLLHYFKDNGIYIMLKETRISGRASSIGVIISTVDAKSTSRILPITVNFLDKQQMHSSVD
eukprot:scaffold22841_cov21-Cyclotella_meneghiniana.AAC.2